MSSIEDKLQGWTGPSSATEQDKQDRTERMIKEAVRDHPGFADCSLKVYAKGSYANNTNVRADSDVDIAVQCTDLQYWEEATAGARGPGQATYTGPWTPAKLRAELEAALEAKFAGQVDASGSTAFRIDSSTARVEADVVPCFSYRYYYSPSSYRDGTKIFKKDGLSLINFPDQQIEHGTAKNDRTSTRYKKAVRVMKRVENAMVASGAHRYVPSFFVECLVYNVPDSVLTRSTWTDIVRGVIVHVFNELKGPEPADNGSRWLEVNECKYLFHSAQKWSRTDGRDFAKGAWNYLGYAT